MHRLTALFLALLTGIAAAAHPAVPVHEINRIKAVPGQTDVQFDTPFTFLNSTVRDASISALGISTGSMATDSLWDAVGDLAVGSGANTSVRLARGTALQVLRVNSGGTNLEWATVAGTGDVVGPAGAANNQVARFDSTTGKLIKASSVTIADTTGDIVAGKYNGLTIGSSTGTLTINAWNVDAAGNTTIPIAAQALTFTGPTTARSFAFPDANATLARTDAGQTFTGTQVFTSPDIATSLTSPSGTFALLNGTVTTVNAFGAATTVNIGASAATVLNLGGSTTAAQLRFLEPSASGTNYTAFKAQTQAANITYTLPATVGAAGTFLKDVAGDGILSWAAPSGSGDALTSGTLAQFAATTSAQLRGVMSDESGAGALLFAGGNIGDATADTLYSIGEVVTSQGFLQTGDATHAGQVIIHSSSPLGPSVTIEFYGSTSRVWGITDENDTFAGIASTQTLTNKTISGASNTLTVRLANDITGLGTGVATALAVNVGTAGAPVLFNGAGGTPSSITLTNATSLPKADVMDAPFFAADAGASDTYAATLSPAITAYVTGVKYRFKANTANTGAATINFNSLGAKTIVKVAGGITTALADNDIRSGQWVDVVYDGTNMQMQSTLGNAASGGSTNALFRGVSIASTFTAYIEEDFILSGAHWTFSSTGTGAQSSAGGGTALYPGHVALIGSTSGSGYAGFRTSTVNNILFNGLTWEWFARIKTASAVSDGTNTYSFFIGFGDAATALPTDGAYFLHNSSSGNWLGRTVDNGSTTSASGGSAVAVATDTWVDLRISVNAAGTLVTFYVYDAGAWTSIGTCATNIPTGSARQTGLSGAILPTAGTLSRTWTVDKIITFAY